ncbi:Major facilitator superfamily domain-containing protein 12, partial [Stegodyphus mimosarum]
MIIVLIIVGVGSFFSIIFHLGVKEHTSTPISSEENSIEKPIDKSRQPAFNPSFGESSNTLIWKEWLLEVQFYQVGLLYMCTRLFQNMSLVFMPLYLQEALRADDDFIAKIPLVMNVSGFFISCSLPKFFKVMSKKITLLTGATLGVGACFWISIGHGPAFCYKGIYGVGAIMGAASSMLVVSSLSFIHDLIGTSAESGAFVYGCMSFCDKMANGIAGMIVQHLHVILCKDCDWFYKDVLSYGVGSIAIISSFVLFSLIPAKLGQRKGKIEDAELKENTLNYGSTDENNETQPLLPKS